MRTTSAVPWEIEVARISNPWATVQKNRFAPQTDKRISFGFFSLELAIPVPAVYDGRFYSIVKRLNPAVTDRRYS